MCAFSTFATPFSSISYQFLGATPDYWCHVSELMEANWTQEQIITFAIPLSNLTGKREGCLMHNYNYTSAAQLGFNKVMSNIPSVSNIDDTLLACSSRVYNTSQYESSIVTEWDLTCDRRALYSTTSSVMQAGTLLGSLLYGHLLEAIGRRKTVLFSSVSSILTSALIIASHNVEVFIFLRMLNQIFDIGYYMGPVILSCPLLYEVRFTLLNFVY
ncbi:hypothetical protein Pmani_016350 [Petrolisthes manimaculis]|uniref:Major facilitator superfamily (MFS) profile domain-containing protein n=1 Tax=Petrolisthes manimaculis TaxID=1843537 RepID=A0AAE1PP35_9EUCA|nr:hypothetical protein Pmani_016350 [Petrolisthes manimaculis]